MFLNILVTLIVTQKVKLKKVLTWDSEKESQSAL